MSFSKVIRSISSSSLDALSNYLIATKNYYELRYALKLVKLISLLVRSFVTSMLVLLGSLFLLISFTIWLGEKLRDFSLAFLITAGLIFLLAIVIRLAKEPISNLVARTVSEDLLDE